MQKDHDARVINSTIMKKRFFKKELLKNRLQYADGSVVPFEAAAEDRGVIVLDEKNQDDAKRIVELKSICGTRGVSEITEEAYEEIKKKQPSTRVSGLSKGPRLHEINRDPFRQQSVAEKVAVAPGAAAPVSAAPVVAGTNADTAAAPEGSKPVEEKPIAPNFKAPTKRAPRNRGSKKNDGDAKTS